MKKKYMKPEIMFEDFSLNTSIAGSCESIVGNPSKDSCGIITSGGDVVFNEGAGCVFTPVDMGGKDDEWDGFCYHVPIDSKTLFYS